jgi:hypothetical protein
MEDNPTTAVAAAEEAPRMTFFQRLIGIYFEPAKTFEDISRRRSWLGIFILICVANLGVTYLLQWRMDPADAARKGLAMSEPVMKRFLGPEQLAQIQAQAEKQALQPKSFWAKYGPIVTTPLGAYIVYLIMAAIFLLAFMVIGAGISYRKSFTVAVWGMGPPGVLVTLLSVLFIFIKNPLDLDIVPIYNVVSNLGPLVDFKAHPVLNSLFSSIDIFSLWTVILLSLGFAAMSEKKITAGKAAVPIVVLWVIWILIKMGFWSILG